MKRVSRYLIPLAIGVCLILGINHQGFFSAPPDRGTLEVVSIDGIQPEFRGNETVTLFIIAGDGRQIRSGTLQGGEAGRLKQIIGRTFLPGSVARVAPNRAYLGHLWGGPKADLTLYELQNGEEILIRYEDSVKEFEGQRTGAWSMLILFGLFSVGWLIFQARMSPTDKLESQKQAREVLTGRMYFNLENYSPGIAGWILAGSILFGVGCWFWDAHLLRNSTRHDGEVTEIYAPITDKATHVAEIRLNSPMPNAEPVQTRVDLAEIRSGFAVGNEVGLLHNPKNPAGEWQIDNRFNRWPLTLVSGILVLVCLGIYIVFSLIQFVRRMPVFN